MKIPTSLKSFQKVLQDIRLEYIRKHECVVNNETITSSVLLRYKLSIVKSFAVTQQLSFMQVDRTQLI